MHKNQVDKDKKDAKILKRIINETTLNKIIKKHTIKKVIDISWIDNTELFNKIVMMLLVDTIKIKNHLNYYLFKTF